ncbi:hypothetical protein DFH06DRAFT_1346152 [Mycena polygramma]|nr:hypothetical protein DFH06DRAFT_1346152 [Mycena polygramma]
MSDSEEAELNETYGHFLSTKSEEFERDTFVFVSVPRKAQLYFGWNQKITSVTNATLHRWVKIMSGIYAMNSDVPGQGLGPSPTQARPDPARPRPDPTPV